MHKRQSSNFTTKSRIANKELRKSKEVLRTKTSFSFIKNDTYYSVQRSRTFGTLSNSNCFNTILYSTMTEDGSQSFEFWQVTIRKENIRYPY